MSSNDKIINAEAELAELKQELKSPLSRQDEHDINLRIIAKEYQLTELYKLNAPTGENNPVDIMHRIPANSMHKKVNNSYNHLDTSISSQHSFTLTSLSLRRLLICFITFIKCA